VTVLVAIPYFGVAAELIDEAVRCALAQSHQDTVVLVTGDGQRPPISFKHHRLVVGTLPVNRGAPFTQQAMILGSPFEHYAPHGADDWTARDHVQRLIDLRAPAAGSSSVWWHEPARRPRILRSPRTWIEFGLFRTDLLRSIGGYAAHEPCGQDSVVISILLKTGRVALSRVPTYHKRYRADSLTHHPDTRGGSQIRTAVRVRNHEVLERCAAIGWERVDEIRAYRDQLVPVSLRVELDAAAAEVARWLR
jgi:hypothetical protein